MPKKLTLAPEDRLLTEEDLAGVQTVEVSAGYLTAALEKNIVLANARKVTIIATTPEAQKLMSVFFTGA